MAKRTQTLLIDDIDGSPAEETLTFGLDGVIYEIDVNVEHAEEIREKFAELLPRAKRVGGRAHPRRGLKPASDGEAKKIRTWAQENGYTLGDRGRIPREIREAYAAGTPATAPSESTEAFDNAPTKDASTGRFVSKKTTEAA